MTPIAEVFMLSIDSKLDYDLLKQICMTGHSRVPVYEEVEVPLGVGVQVGVGASIGVGMGIGMGMGAAGTRVGMAKTQRVKKIVGILLVKQCVLLDPKGA
jgi:metal transporter CNNM